MPTALNSGRVKPRGIESLSNLRGCLVIRAYKVNTCICIYGFKSGLIGQWTMYSLSKPYVVPILKTEQCRSWTHETVATVAVAPMYCDIIPVKTTPGDRARLLDVFALENADLAAHLADEIKWAQDVIKAPGVFRSNQPMEFQIRWVFAYASTLVAIGRLDPHARWLLSEMVTWTLAEMPSDEAGARFDQRVSLIGSPAVPATA